MTNLGWVVIGGGCGALLGLIFNAPFGPLVGVPFGFFMGLLIFSPFRLHR